MAPFGCLRWPCIGPTVCLGRAPHSVAQDAKASDTAKFGRFHRGMLEHGVYLAPSQFEAGEDCSAAAAATIARLSFTPPLLFQASPRWPTRTRTLSTPSTLPARS